MLAQYTGASIVEKNIQKKFQKNIQNFREIVVRQILFVQIGLKNGCFHPESQGITSHLVYMKVQDQTFPTVYGTWLCEVVHRFCVKAEKRPNHC
jgi:hypothetical protein